MTELYVIFRKLPALKVVEPSYYRRNFYMPGVVFMSAKLPGLLIFLLLTLALFSACGSESIATTTPIPPTPTEPPRAYTVIPTTLPITESWKQNWLKGIPCKPPCWEGITPGVTSMEETVKILKQSSLITSAKLTVSVREDFATSIEWEKEDSVIGWAIYDERISPQKAIFVMIPNNNMRFKMSEVIAAYGEPSHVRSYVGRVENYPPTYFLSIVYLNQGFQLTALTGAYKPIINNDTILDRLMLFIPGLEGYKTAYYNKTEEVNSLVPWQGFKEFEFYCRAAYGVDKTECPLSK